MFSCFLSGNHGYMHNLWIGNRFFLKQHMSVHTDKRTFKCDICEKTLTSYKTFANHKKCHMTWTCDICEQIIPLVREK